MLYVRIPANFTASNAKPNTSNRSVSKNALTLTNAEESLTVFHPVACVVELQLNPQGLVNFYCLKTAKCPTFTGGCIQTRCNGLHCDGKYDRTETRPSGGSPFYLT